METLTKVRAVGMGVPLGRSGYYLGKKVLVTGAAGFVGYWLTEALLREGATVVGVDNLNDYYDPALKHDRLSRLEANSRFSFFKVDIAEKDLVELLFEVHEFELVFNLAAQAGVRYSIDNPAAYMESNLVGFFNIVEACRHHSIEKLIYASSSSVYGNSDEAHFSESQSTDEPVSLYAATKKANEVIAHSYSHLYGIYSVGLRFFTVYGPKGRPDMAYYKFADRIMAGKPIELYNGGNLFRDFTYIDDIVEGVMRVGTTTSKTGNVETMARVLNIGNNKPVNVGYFVDVLEEHLRKKAVRVDTGMQPGDVFRTSANIDGIKDLVGFDPKVSVEDGLAMFCGWYREYHEIVDERLLAQA